MELSVQGVGNEGVELLAVDDETIASRSQARLLITAATEQGVEALARRVHGDGPRAPFPFFHIGAGELPVERDLLKTYFTSVRAAAAGGTILISAVEEMPPTVQDALLELLGEPDSEPGPSTGVRLISGTTVSLLDRVAAGVFSDRLFYRLNTLHIGNGVARADVAAVRSAGAAR